MKKKLVLGLLLAALSAFAEPAPSPSRSHSARAVMRSEIVDAVEYDMQSRTMTVFLRTGRIYAYASVPETVFSGFVNSDRPGRYFAKAVRGKFEGHRLMGREALAMAKPPVVSD